IGSVPFTIIGVAPRGFTGMVLESPAAFIPITTMGSMISGLRDPTMYYATYSASWMEMLVHQRPGVSMAAATADMTTAYQRSYAAQREMNPRVAPIESAKPHAIVAP